MEMRVGHHARQQNNDMQLLSDTSLHGCLITLLNLYVCQDELTKFRSQSTVLTGVIRAKIIRRPLREAISRGFSALREIRAKGG